MLTVLLQYCHEIIDHIKGDFMLETLAKGGCIYQVSISPVEASQPYLDVLNDSDWEWKPHTYRAVSCPCRL